MADTEKLPERPKDVPGDQEFEGAPPTRPGRITTDRGPNVRRRERREQEDAVEEPPNGEDERAGRRGEAEEP